MSKKIEKQLPAAIQRVRDDLQRWRRGRRGGERIPESVWVAATHAARRYGVHRVSSALGVEYAQLKRRVSGSQGAGAMGATADAEFVEVGNARGQAGAGCVIELEKGNGTWMRVCVGDAATVDWARVKEAFLGA